MGIIMETVATAMTFTDELCGDIVLNRDDVTAVIVDEYGYMVDYFTSDTPWETTTNVSIDWSHVYVSYDAYHAEDSVNVTYPTDNRALHLMERELGLFADCYGLSFVFRDQFGLV